MNRDKILFIKRFILLLLLDDGFNFANMHSSSLVCLHILPNTDLLAVFNEALSLYTLA